MASLTLEEEIDAAWAHRPRFVDGHGKVWSAKQAHVLRLGERDGRFVIIPGPGQCGKTEAAIPGFLLWLSTAHGGATAVMLAKGKTQLAAVVKPRIEEYCRRHMIVPSFGWDGHEYIDLPSVAGEPNRVWLIAAGTRGKTTQGASQTAERIQGMTLVGAYIDEITNCAPSLVEMLLSRFLTVPDSKIVATCNPDAPTHFIKRNWIDRIESGEVSGEHIAFRMPDHPTIERADAEEIAQGWSGVFYRRMFLGEWAAAEGIIYPNVKRRLPESGAQVARWEVAIDFAPKRIGHALLVAWVEGRPWVVDELRTDARLAEMDTLDKMARRLVQWAGARGVDVWLLPSDAKDLKPYLEMHSKAPVAEPVQERLYGINATRLMLESSLCISPRCRLLLAETDSYAWHPERPDEPDKDSAAGAHAVDALRYWAATYWARATGEKPTAPQRGRR